MIVLISVAHQSHELAAFCHGDVELRIGLASLLDQVSLLFFILCSITISHKLGIVHLILHLFYFFVNIVNVCLFLPSLHYIHNESGIPTLPMSQCALNNSLCVTIVLRPDLPELKCTSSALEVSTLEGISNATVACLFQLSIQACIAGVFVSNFFR